MGRATRHLHSFHLFGNVPARPTSELRSAIGAGIGRLLVSPCLALPHRDETTVIQAASFPPGVLARLGLKAPRARHSHTLPFLFDRRDQYVNRSWE
jgi:hypothetical protein